MKKGLVIVISSPSGGGKTAVCREVRKFIPAIKFSISLTTRPPRRGEKNGRDYFFVTEDEFKKYIRQNKLIEYALVHNYYYGTPKDFLEKTISQGNDIILAIDVQGAKKIKRIYPDAVSIFILPPSLKVLKQRLQKRGLDDKETIETRLKNAGKEIKQSKDYEYIVINKKLTDTAKQVCSIIESEHN